MNECIAGFGKNERVIMLGNMNAKVLDGEKEWLVEMFRVPGMYENEESVIEMCMEGGLIAVNI